MTTPKPTPTSIKSLRVYFRSIWGSRYYHYSSDSIPGQTFAALTELEELRALYRRPVMVDNSVFMHDGDIRKIEAENDALRAEVAALKAKVEEREIDMHSRIRKDYDTTVAECWRKSLSESESRATELAARVTELAEAKEALNVAHQHIVSICDLCPDSRWALAIRNQSTQALSSSASADSTSPAADLAAYTDRIRRETVERIVGNLGFCHGGIWPLDERHGTGRGENGDPNGPEEECGPWSALMADDKSAIYRAAGLAPAPTLMEDLDQLAAKPDWSREDQQALARLRAALERLEYLQNMAFYKIHDDRIRREALEQLRISGAGKLWCDTTWADVEAAILAPHAGEKGEGG
jgi:hypothetical protein